MFLNFSGTKFTMPFFQKRAGIVVVFLRQTPWIFFTTCKSFPFTPANQYADWKLQLVGDGRDKAFYHYLVKKWNLQRVEFAGQQNPQEYYRRASLFLMEGK